MHEPLPPIAIVRRADDDGPRSWMFVYDHVGEIHSRRHRSGEEPKWVVRDIRVDQPRDMVAGESVPLDERDRRDAQEVERKRERRREVEKLADGFVRGERNHYDLRADFQLEREVMDELWSRFREVTGDRFLVAALTARPQDHSSTDEGGE